MMNLLLKHIETLPPLLLHVFTNINSLYLSLYTTKFIMHTKNYYMELEQLENGKS